MNNKSLRTNELEPTARFQEENKLEDDHLLEIKIEDTEERLLKEYAEKGGRVISAHEQLTERSQKVGTLLNCPKCSEYIDEKCKSIYLEESDELTKYNSCPFFSVEIPK